MKKKQLGLIGGMLLLSCLYAMPAYAGQWYEKSGEWRYQDDNGQDVVNSWAEVDGKKYFFNGSGNMMSSTIVENCYLGDDGAMIPTEYLNRNQRFTLAYKSGDISVIPEAQRPFYNICAEILKQTTNATSKKYENELNIHDYIVKNTAYDFENYKNNSIPASSYTAEGVLSDGVGVCAGYAEAFQLLCNMSGIPCITVSGSANGYKGWGSHAWNQVKLDDGQWYWVDTTFDDPVPNQEGYVRYKYFNVTSSKLRSDHKWTGGVDTSATQYSASKLGLSTAGEDKGWMSEDEREGAITSQRELMDLLTDSFNSQETTIQFVVSGFKPSIKKKYKEFHVSNVKTDYTESGSYKSYTLTVTYEEEAEEEE